VSLDVLGSSALAKLPRGRGHLAGGGKENRCRCGRGGGPRKTGDFRLGLASAIEGSCSGWSTGKKNDGGEGQTGLLHKGKRALLFGKGLLPTVCEEGSEAPIIFQTKKNPHFIKKAVRKLFISYIAPRNERGNFSRQATLLGGSLKIEL